MHPGHTCIPPPLPRTTASPTLPGPRSSSPCASPAEGMRRHRPTAGWHSCSSAARGRAPACQRTPAWRPFAAHLLASLPTSQPATCCPQVGCPTNGGDRGSMAACIGRHGKPGTHSAGIQQRSGLTSPQLWHPRRPRHLQLDTIHVLRLVRHNTTERLPGQCLGTGCTCGKLSAAAGRAGCQQALPLPQAPALQDAFAALLHHREARPSTTCAATTCAMATAPWRAPGAAAA